MVCDLIYTQKGKDIIILTLAIGGERYESKTITIYTRCFRLCTAYGKKCRYTATQLKDTELKQLIEQVANKHKMMFDQLYQLLNQ